MSIKIKAKLFWAQLNEVNDLSGKYQVDLCNLSDQAVKELTEAGLNINNRADDQYNRGNYITCKSTFPIKAITGDGVPISTDTRIGNGSVAVAVLDVYDWSFKGKKGKSPSLKTLAVTDLVLFEEEEEILDIRDAA